MTMRVRFILLSAFNTLLMIGLILAGHYLGWNMSKRLIDFDMANSQDFQAFIVFLILLPVALVVNLLLLSGRQEDPLPKEIARILEACRN